MDYFELIEEYKKDRLSNEVRQEFEMEVKKNTELRKAMENHDVASQLFDLLIEDDIREQVENVKSKNARHIFKDINSNNSEAQKAIEPGKIFGLKSKNISYLIAAALFIIIVGSTFIINNNLIRNTPEQIFASYYTTYPNLESPTRAVLDFTDVLAVRTAAYTAYDKADFKEVTMLLSKLTPGYAQELSDNFYLGLSYLELSEWGNAAALFEYVANSNSEYKNEAKWYLGLSLLRMENCDKAKEIFTPIRDAGLDKSKEARQIMDKMKC